MKEQARYPREGIGISEELSGLWQLEWSIIIPHSENIFSKKEMRDNHLKRRYLQQPISSWESFMQCCRTELIFRRVHIVDWNPQFQNSFNYATLWKSICYGAIYENKDEI